MNSPRSRWTVSLEVTLDGLVGAVADGDVACLGLLLAKNQHVGDAIDGAGLANLVADLLVTLVDLHAHAGVAQLLRNLVRVVAGLLGDGEHLDLAGREPRGELARVLLDEHAGMPMKRSNEPKPAR